MSWELEAIEQQDAAQEVLQTVEATHAEAVKEDQEIMETLSEAVKRIEEANLWKTLLNLDVFQSGSARQEIVNSANAKMRKFARENLEICVGIKSEVSTKQQTELKMPFDSEEMQALKILAAKVLKRDVTKAVLSDYKPQVAQVVTSGVESKVRTVSPPPQQPVKKAAVKLPQEKKKTPTKRPAHYIPPATNYIPNPQLGATASTEGLPAQSNMNSLVSQLIQQASGGNVLAVDSGTVAGTDDINERF